MLQSYTLWFFCLRRDFVARSEESELDRDRSRDLEPLRRWLLPLSWPSRSVAVGKLFAGRCETAGRHPCIVARIVDGTMLVIIAGAAANAAAFILSDRFLELLGRLCL